MGTWDAPSAVDIARPDADLTALWSSPDARLLLVGRDGTVAVNEDARCIVPPGAAPSSSDLFLGRVAGQPWFAREQAPDGASASPRLLEVTPEQRQLITRALALVEWHRLAPFCESCGSATEPRPGGASRRCLDCDIDIFPRMDPAVIVAIVDADDRLLLAHASAWGQGRVSVLAGFVEAGESAEQACHREVAEESGVELSALRFYGTQPWPYPRSLMLAFVARAASRTVRLDGIELEWGRFYSRDEVVAEQAAGRLVLPGHTSIAARMIADWLAGTLPRPE